MDNIKKSKRNTLQKSIVFEIFREMKNHPSAGMVYAKIHEKYPNISRATVYRLLADAAEEGEILRLKINDCADRYDITTFEHCHFSCRVCGNVFDIDSETDKIKSGILRELAAKNNHEIEDMHLEFHGICVDCKKNI